MNIHIINNMNMHWISMCTSLLCDKCRKYDKLIIAELECIELLCSVVDCNVVAGIPCRLDEVAEDRTPPGPVAVSHDVA